MINEKLNKDILDLINENTIKINNLQGKILWRNINPSSNISEGTTVTLSSDKYDYLIWIYCYNTNATNTNIHKSTICLKGNSVMMNIIGYSTGVRNRRQATYVNDTTYTLRVGMGEDNIASDGVCIPLYVIGCKF